MIFFFKYQYRNRIGRESFFHDEIGQDLFLSFCHGIGVGLDIYAGVGREES